eukprot:gene17840-biopygen1689
MGKSLRVMSTAVPMIVLSAEGADCPGGYAPIDEGDTACKTIAETIVQAHVDYFSAYIRVAKQGTHQAEGMRVARPDEPSVCPGLPRADQGCPGLPQSAPVCPGLPRSTEVCPGLPTSAHVCPGCAGYSCPKRALQLSTRCLKSCQ